MIVAWTRAAVLTLCGRCGSQILKGTPLCQVKVGPRIRPRCPVCAGEAVPADLPELVERSRIEIQPTFKASRAPLFAAIGPMASVGTLARDWKQQQIAREPGEDDE